MSLRECAEYIKQKFHIPSVRVFGDLDATLEKAAISPGSGKSMIGAALESGAEVLITGDIGHHEGIDAVAQGLMIIDAGHFGIEQIFVSYMKEYIKREIPGLQVFTEIQKSPFVVL
jgi:putative NIF3 family GTP cyclohydrolase 1 type 2